MFDSVLGKADAQQSRLGSAAAVSVVVHVLLVLVAYWLSTRPEVQEVREAAVMFFAPPPPPPPPPAGGGTTQTAKAMEKPRVQKTPKRDVLVQPVEVPSEKPAEAEPETQPESSGPAQPGGVAGGVEGGVQNGVVGGVVGGDLRGQLGGQLGGTLNFGEGMSRPERLTGEDPRYTREALDARVQGVMIVRCVISVDGEPKNCTIVKSLPHMDEAVLAAIKTWKFKPVMYEGRPVPVDYKIPVRLVLPK